MNETSRSTLKELGLKVARNTLSNAAGRLWVMAISFLVTPYLVLKLGDERFGIWAFVTVLVGYFGIFDLGLGVALVKYVAEFHAAQEYKLLNAAINTAFSVMMLLVGLIVGAGVIASGRLLHLFKLPPQNYSEARFAFVGALLILLGQACLGVFQSVLNGLQRMGWFNLIAIITSIPSTAGVILVLHRGYGLRALTINNAIMFALSALLTTVFVNRACPEYHFDPLLVDKTMLKRLLSFGGQMQITNIGSLIAWHGDKMMIGAFLNMALVTTYELGYRIAMTARMLPTFLLTAFMPAVTEAHVRQDPSMIQRLFDLGSRYLALSTFPITALFVYEAPLIMAAWMKESRPEAVWAARMLLLGFLVNLLGGIGTTIARGVGRPDLETRLIFPYLALNFGLGIPLILKLGFWGPLIATPFSTIAVTIYLFWQLESRLNLKLGRFLKEGMPVPALGALFASGVVATLHSLGLSWSTKMSRLVLVEHLLLECFVFTGAYALFVWKVRLHEVDDWTLIKNGLGLVVSRVFRTG
jgi:O-antigen/teichoic acid export membrane protein